MDRKSVHKSFICNRIFWSFYLLKRSTLGAFFKRKSQLYLVFFQLFIKTKQNLNCLYFNETCALKSASFPIPSLEAPQWLFCCLSIEQQNFFEHCSIFQTWEVVFEQFFLAWIKTFFIVITCSFAYKPTGVFEMAFYVDCWVFWFTYRVSTFVLFWFILCNLSYLWTES